MGCRVCSAARPNGAVEILSRAKPFKGKSIMCRSAWGQKLCLIVVTAICVIMSSADIEAEQTVALPARWQQMAPTEFAAAIRQLFENDTFKLFSPEDQDTVKQHGLDLFLHVDLNNTSLRYRTLEVLHHLARYLLDPGQIEKAKTALVARRDNWAGQPYAEVRAKVVMMMRWTFQKS